MCDADETAKTVYDIIETPNASPPGGHYVQGVAWGGLITVSGQLPVGTPTGQGTNAEFEAQARAALLSFLEIVKAGGGDKASVLNVRAYIVGVEYWPIFNRVYSEIFGQYRPARAVVPVPELHLGYYIEIEGTAVTVGHHNANKV
ncbi:RidA family protein [Marinibacterium sp. SX1]|uniref:RidA family protein n=1 Tax=Marinibacterium sp. SX1 TaxID=3388424 RepID=UPI003D178240